MLPAHDSYPTGTTPSFRDAIRPVITLGWPMILTQLFIMGTGFVDTVMAADTRPQILRLYP